jgi:8-oxo-dGTP diphosphatase
MLTVVAAVIEWDGKVLVCQRRRGDTFELRWEFPGGKVKQGESTKEALQRELTEELGVDAEVGEELFRTQHRYAELSEPIELIFLAAKAEAGAMRNVVFESMEWRTPEKLPELDFLPADREFVEKLARREIAITWRTVRRAGKE